MEPVTMQREFRSPFCLELKRLLFLNMPGFATQVAGKRAPFPEYSDADSDTMRSNGLECHICGNEVVALAIEPLQAAARHQEALHG